MVALLDERLGAADKEREALSIVTRSGPVSLSIEVARTAQEQSKGLMFRRSMGQQEGMLFTYEPEQHITMWMHNTYLALDMIFIRANGRIHRIERNTEPFSRRQVLSGAKVLGVLEVNAGQSRKLGIRPGDLVRHPHFGTGGSE